MALNPDDIFLVTKEDGSESRKIQGTNLFSGIADDWFVLVDDGNNGTSRKIKVKDLCAKATDSRMMLINRGVSSYKTKSTLVCSTFGLQPAGCVYPATNILPIILNGTATGVGEWAGSDLIGPPNGDQFTCNWIGKVTAQNAGSEFTLLNTASHNTDPHYRELMSVWIAHADWVEKGIKTPLVGTGARLQGGHPGETSNIIKTGAHLGCTMNVTIPNSAATNVNPGGRDKVRIVTKDDDIYVAVSTWSYVHQATAGFQGGWESGTVGHPTSNGQTFPYSASNSANANKLMSWFVTMSCTIAPQYSNGVDISFHNDTDNVSTRRCFQEIQPEAWFAASSCAVGKKAVWDTTTALEMGTSGDGSLDNGTQCFAGSVYRDTTAFVYPP